jgi:hypothetical protein
MRSPVRLPWAITGGRKAVSAHSSQNECNGWIAIVAGDDAVRWSGRSYDALSGIGSKRSARRSTCTMRSAGTILSTTGLPGGLGTFRIYGMADNCHPTWKKINTQVED